MESKKAKNILESSLLGFAYHKVVTDDSGKLTDYRFLEINQAYEKLTGLKADDIIGKTVTEVLPGIENGDFDWIGVSGKIALEGGNETFEQYSEPLDKWYQVQIHSDEKGYFAAVFTDITERKQAEEALQEQRSKLRNLHDAVDQLQRQTTEEDILQTAVKVAEEILGFALCDISLLEGEYLVPRTKSTDLDPSDTKLFKVGEGIAGKTAERGETIWGDDVRNHPEAKPTSGEFKGFISVPIGELGVLQVISKEVGSFNQSDVELAEILAGHLNEEIQRIRLEEELKEQAIRDSLTGLYNRRYFNETLEKEIEQATRYQRPLAFLMLDVNQFKKINDRYSHQTGDEVLKEVAKMLRENVRSADTVVRYGGDEFLIMMPETNGEAERAATRLKESLKMWNKETDLLDFPLTFAMGTAHWSRDQGRSVEEALNEADQRMYEDKRR